jgi:hypothetical protein
MKTPSWRETELRSRRHAVPYFFPGSLDCHPDFHEASNRGRVPPVHCCSRLLLLGAGQDRIVDSFAAVVGTTANVLDAPQLEWLGRKIELSPRRLPGWASAHVERNNQKTTNLRQPRPNQGNPSPIPAVAHRERVSATESFVAGPLKPRRFSCQISDKRGPLLLRVLVASQNSATVDRVTVL